MPVPSDVCSRRSTFRAAALLAAVASLSAGAAQALIYTYTNTTSGAVSYSAAAGGAAGCATPLVRTFSVGDSFTVATVGLGFNTSHTTRGDVRVTLVAPGGTSLQLMAGGSGDGDDNYDILLSSNTEGALDDNDTDPTAAPNFNRIVQVANIDTTFAGVAANGTWTLNICDINNNSVDGTFNQAYLMLSSSTAVTSTCTGTVSYDWGNLGGTGVNPTALSGHAVTVGGITISQTSTADYAGTAGTGANIPFSMRNTTNGNHAGYYSLIMDASGGGTEDNESVGLQSVIGFSVPVRDLSLTLLDVDITGGSWEDQIEVIGTDATGNRVPYTLAPVGGGNAQLAADLAEGDGAAATTATTGNLDLDFSGSVSALTLNYTQGSDPAADNNQMVIGLSDFSQCGFDYGDAPNTYGTLLSGGARHVLGSREVWLGTNRPDGEADGQAGAAATTDDTTTVGGVDDEDGVSTFPACPNNGTYSVSVSASDTRTSGSDGQIRGYIDWNRDGDFADANEISAATTVARGNADPTSYSVSWSSVPSNCGGTTSTYARFRYSTDTAAIASPTGQASDGEVEDYAIAVNTLPVTIAQVQSEISARGLTVRWTTASESANAGFRLWAEQPGKGRTLLAKVAGTSPDSFLPRHYGTTVAAGASSILIEDVGLDGRNRFHGPYAVGASFGAEPQVESVDWSAIKAETGVVSPLDRLVAAENGVTLPPSRAGAAASSALLLVREEGIHRVTYEELASAGVDLAGIEAAAIAVLNRGVGVPRYIGGAGKAFGPGSFIEFVAQPVLTLASPVDAYVLQADARRAVPVVTASAGWAGRVGVVAASERYHPDRAYSYASPSGDPWYDQGLLAWGGSSSLRRQFDLPNLASGPVSLDLAAWGYGDFPGASPDHHVVVRLNGVDIVDGRFDGVTAWRRSVDVTSLARESANELEVVVPGDTGYDFDYVAWEGFDVRYSRQAFARNGRFKGALAAGASGTIAGFSDEQAVSWWQLSPRSGAQRGEQVPVGGSLTAPTGATVYAASSGAILHAGIVAGVPVAKTASKAEMVIISHPAFADAVGALVALEQARGLTTEVVDVETIYAAYSDHAASADAVRSFIAASLALRGTRYVLIVGADTSDPYDHLGLGSVSYVPTDYVTVGDFIHVSPTDETLADRNRDGVADVPIGRLPVRTAGELSTLVAKIARWEANLQASSREAVFVAGASDSAFPLPPLSRSYGSQLSGWQISYVNADDVGATSARGAVLAAMNAGTPLVSYVGHAAMGVWDFTPLLRWEDAAGLTNSTKPNLVTQWACWNSYYVEPTVESLSARLLRAPNGGVAGAIGAATLTSEASHRRLGELFFARVNAGAATLGEAFQGAKRDLAAAGGGQDAILGMTLLGDPAMSLPPVR